MGLVLARHGKEFWNFGDENINFSGLKGVFTVRLGYAFGNFVIKTLLSDFIVLSCALLCPLVLLLQKLKNSISNVILVNFFSFLFSSNSPCISILLGYIF